MKVTGELVQWELAYQPRRVTLLVETLIDLETVRGLHTFLRADAPQNVVALANRLHDEACAGAPPAGTRVGARVYRDELHDVQRIGAGLPK